MDEAGVVQFREDVYERDARVIAALNEALSR
jgi:murein L,D-transpeptidase YcbB/YkuD